MISSSGIGSRECPWAGAKGPRVPGKVVPTADRQSALKIQKDFFLPLPAQVIHTLSPWQVGQVWEKKNKRGIFPDPLHCGHLPFPLQVPHAAIIHFPGDAAARQATYLPMDRPGRPKMVDPR
jgi:hypothetical protein